MRRKPRGDDVSFGALAALAVAAMVVLFTLVWIVAEQSRNAGLVDVAWAGGFTVVALLVGSLGAGDALRRVAIAGLYSIWSLRLALHLGRRVFSEHPKEDGRYEALRRRWADRASRRFWWFFQAQALLVVALSAPLFAAALNPAPALTGREWAAIALALSALAGESLADRQLRRFRVAHDRSRVCDVGLWRYSRHPNYFFEWLIWCAFAVFATASPGGWWTLYCPALMLYFLFRVTGIPATEAQAVRTRGYAYRRYQQTTSAFVPWLPRKAPGDR